MRKWFSIAAILAENIAGLPKTRVGLANIAAKEWRHKSRKVPGKTKPVWEYHISVLPASAQAELRVKQARNAAAAQPAAAKKAAKALWAHFEGLPQHQKQACEARLKAVLLAETFHAGGMSAGEAMQAAGAFKGASKPAQEPLQGRYAAKLQALWIAGWNLGAIRDKSSRAMLAFVERQTGISHTRFLHYADDAAKVIEALKSWIVRETGLFWGKKSQSPEELSARIAYRQWEMLAKAGVLAVHSGGAAWPLRESFPEFVVQFLGAIRQPSQKEWIKIMNALGEEVRSNAQKDG